MNLKLLSELKNVFQEFFTEGSLADINPFGSGHINDTFLLKTAEADRPNYILQRINHRVFKDVPGLMSNIEIVTRHIREKINLHYKSGFIKECYTYLPTRNNKIYYQDDQGNYWRLTYFIENSRSFEVIDSTKKARSGGLAYGQFLAYLADLSIHKLLETIPNFHNIEWRLENFKNALNHDRYKRGREITADIEFIQKRQEEMGCILKLGREGKIKMRVTHNDTKFNNILFDERDQVLGVIDLDTVMPGYIHYDFGDAIRTGTNQSAEDEADLFKVEMNIQLFEAFAAGFLQKTKIFLTEIELAHLAFSAKLLTFIMGLRFLTDYIDGDIYYKIRHPQHNLQRARAQFKLLSSMEKQYREMQNIIEKLIAS